MSLTRTQKRWALGGSIGAGALLLGYEAWKHRRPAHGEREHHEHHEHNGRGEYGRKKKHHKHHEGHGNGDH